LVHAGLLATAASDVVLNEVVSSNGGSLRDLDGDAPDWIELVNRGDQLIELTGWTITDDPARPARWVFPDVALGAGDYLLLYASGKDRQDALHLNFSISADGEPLLLFNDQGTLVDSIVVPPLARDVAWGRLPEEPLTWRYFPQPTPGSPNTTPHYAGFLERPAFSQPPGFHEEPFELDVIVTDAQAVIRYTLDGTVPDESSPILSAPLPITARVGDPNVLANIRSSGLHEYWQPPTTEIRKATTLRVRAFRDDWAPSPVVSGTYFVISEPAERYRLAVVSLISPPDGLFSDETGIYVPGNLYDPNATNSVGNNFTGNYHMRGDAWERPAHVEMWDESGQPAFALDAGVRIHGGAGRMYDRKSLRLYFRSEYGTAELEHPLFGEHGVTTFKRLLLRGSSQDRYGAMLRDELAAQLADGLNLDYARWRPAILFINGEYWGIHYWRERIDEHHLAIHHGADPDALDRLNRETFVDQGDRVHWNAFIAALNAANPAQPGDLIELGRWIDLDAYMNYISAQAFVANYDWPENNNWYWRARAVGLPDPAAAPHPADGRWRWIFADIDISMAFLTGMEDDPTMTRLIGTGKPHSIVIDRLIAFPDFQRDLVNRMLDHLNSRFLPANTLAACDGIRAQLLTNISEHERRWIRPGHPWSTHLQRIRTFLSARPPALRNHLRDYFQLGSDTTIRLAVHPPRTGTIALNSWQPPADQLPAQGIYLAGNPIDIVPRPAPGYRLAAWEGTLHGQPATPLRLDPTLATEATALFEPDPDYPWSRLEPQPVRLAQESFALQTFDSATPPGTYPDHMVFLQSTVQDPTLAHPMEEPWTLAYNLDNRSRLLGLGSDGIGFINTGNPQEEGGGYVGAAVVALDTVGCTRVELTFLAGTVLPNSRPYALRLQARPEPDAPWFDLLDAAGNPIEYASHPTPGHTQAFGPIALPASLLGRPYAQLRWRYHALPTTATGPRAFLRLDDITLRAIRTADAMASLWVLH
jgi:hypothetical protein